MSADIFEVLLIDGPLNGLRLSATTTKDKRYPEGFRLRPGVAQAAGPVIGAYAFDWPNRTATFDYAKAP